MRTEDQSSISWLNLSLVVAPVLVLIFSDILRATLSIPPQPVAYSAPNIELSGFDAAGRLYILVALLFAIVMSFFAVILFWKDLADEFGSQMRRKLLATLAVGLVVGGTWSIGWTYAEGPTSVTSLGSAFLESAPAEFGRIANCREVAGLEGDTVAPGPTKAGETEPVVNCSENGPTSKAMAASRTATATGALESQTFAELESLITAARFVLMIGAAIAIVGAVSCTVQPSTRLSDAAERAFILHQRIRLKAYINVAAALMLGNLLFQIAWTRWPIMLVSGDAADAFEARVNALALYTGVSMSLAIATFALPVVTILHNRAAALPAPANGTDLASPDPGSGLIDSLAKVLVVLVPAIAGVLPGTIEALRYMGG